MLSEGLKAEEKETEAWNLPEEFSLTQFFLFLPGENRNYWKHRNISQLPKLSLAKR